MQSVQGVAEPKELRRTPKAMARSGMVTERVCDAECELAQFLASSDGPFRVRIGAGDKTSNLVYKGAGLVEHEFLDQTATFESGTSMADVQAALGKHGQVLPWVVPAGGGHQGLGGGICIGEVLAYDFPHPGVSECGSFRDWVLGCTVVLAGGEIIKCGSKAVKSVAGYDLHKLFIGARHTLGVVTRVTVRTYPLAHFESLKFNWVLGPTEPLPPTPLPSQGAGEEGALRIPGTPQEFEEYGRSENKTPPLPVRSRGEGAGGRGSEDLPDENPEDPTLNAKRTKHQIWIQHTLRSDFQSSLAAAKPWLILADQDSCTLWAQVPTPLPRYPNDWVIYGATPEIGNPAQRKLMLKMKQKLDPTNKLNPGAFGFL
jgi:FAD binding domain